VNDKPDLTEPRLPFQDVRSWLGSFAPSQIGQLLTSVGDVVMLVDPAGKIQDIGGAPSSVRGLQGQIGRPWADTVTIESRHKIAEMVANEHPGRWRQVTHNSEGEEFPVRYMVFPVGNAGNLVAVGRDERASAVLQQRLLQVQQSLERDYLSLRQAEARYRLLFEMTAEPMAIVEADSRRIREINPAALNLFGLAEMVNGQPAQQLVHEQDRDRVIAYLGAAAAGADASPIEVNLPHGGEVRLAARAFRQSGVGYLLLRFGQTLPAPATRDERDLVNIVERLPDAFVLADRKLNICAVNGALVELLQAASADQLRGRPLGDFLGRPGIDLDLIVAQVNENEVARNVSTILRGLDGGREEVEVSAVRAGVGGDHYGFSLRVVARRMRDLPPAQHDLPRSVEQLTELIGRMPLKDIVRQSTDLIERQCIEAALAYTSNNRASAAEILGLSRQSLYSKLHRHGLVSTETAED
jgi:transcriptional regulator PpsR